MNTLRAWRSRPVAFCLAVILVSPSCDAFAESTSKLSACARFPVLSTAANLAVFPFADENKTTSDPDVPGSTWSQTTQTAPASTPTPASTPQTNAPPPQQQKTPIPSPSGTAAAPDEQPAGVTASKPSGSAIAPAKQKRIRTYRVRAALLIGAAVAVGVVAAASLGSPAHAQ